MTTREEFAKAALQGLIAAKAGDNVHGAYIYPAGTNPKYNLVHETLAKQAVQYADALIEELKPYYKPPVSCGCTMNAGNGACDDPSCPVKFRA